MKLIKFTLLLSIFTFAAQAEVVNKNNPPDFQQFKTDYTEMVDLANPNRLSHRIFYTKPSSGPDSEWFDAVKQGNLNKIKEMVKKGQDIEVKDTGSLNQTALGWAAFIGDEDMVDYLLSLNANIRATDKADVHHAFKSTVLGKNVKIADRMYNLLKNEIDLDDQSLDREGETYVMVAASNNRIDMVKYLIGLGVNLNLATTIKDKSKPAYDQSALTYACKNNLPEMQKLLIDNGALNHRTGKPSCN